MLGYGTDRFPGFYLSDSGHAVDWQVGTAAEVADVVRARAALGTDGQALVVAQPLPPDLQVDPALHDRLIAEALTAAAELGVHGKDVTPFLLERLHRDSGGATLTANVHIIKRNAALAAEVAVALAER